MYDMMTSPNQKLTHPTIQLLPKCKTLSSITQIHAHMITAGLSLHTYPLARLLSFTSSFSLPYTLSIFSRFPTPSVFLFNTLISSFLHTHTHVAFSLYRSLLSHPSVKPNCFTYPSLFKACVSPPWLSFGPPLHAHVFKFLGPSCDRFVLASLIHYYACCGKLGVARRLFDRICDPDLVIWNSVLGAYARSFSYNYACVGMIDCDEDTNLSLETLYLFRKMQESLSVRPNEITLVALITACANLGALCQGFWAHSYVLKNNLNLNRFVGTALIEMYSKCGCLDLACQLFDQLSHRDTTCYNAMIGGLAIHGHGHRALDVYQKMKIEGLVPDNVTFVVIMCACAHAGLVEEGCKIFESIKEVSGIEPTVEHYGCLVDLLGRAGRFREAEEVVRKMPIKPNAILWRSLLGAATVHGNLEVGEFALKNLIELEPKTSGNYVLLSNMYASVDKWEDVKRVRKLGKEHGIVKMPGSSFS